MIQNQDNDCLVYSYRTPLKFEHRFHERESLGIRSFPVGCSIILVWTGGSKVKEKTAEPREGSGEKICSSQLVNLPMGCQTSEARFTVSRQSFHTPR